MQYLDTTELIPAQRPDATPTGVRTLVALDVSESMDWGNVADAPGLTPREASARIALSTAMAGPEHEIVGFHDGPGGESFARAHHWLGGIRALSPLAIDPDQGLDGAVEAVTGLRYGGTDPALPMLYATRREIEVDLFVIYTDTEVSAGDVHPEDALQSYRRRSGIDARLVTVPMLAESSV